MITIVTLSERPDLLPVGARWAWQQWGQSAGRTLEQVLKHGARYADPLSHDQAFLLLDDGVPAAMASFVASDLDTRPDLTPWLAGVYVDTPFRGRGHAVRVIRRVEHKAVETGATELWLYTWTAAPLYRRLGWHDREMIETRHGPSQLMRRVLSEPSPEIRTGL